MRFWNLVLIAMVTLACGSPAHAVRTISCESNIWSITCSQPQSSEVAGNEFDAVAWNGWVLASFDFDGDMLIVSNNPDLSTGFGDHLIFLFGQAGGFNNATLISSSLPGFTQSNAWITADNRLAIDFDGVTTFGAENAVISLAPIPEPSSWALMALGFCAVGSSMRGRRSFRNNRVG
jgi:hypothetical protein